MKVSVIEFAVKTQLSLIMPKTNEKKKKTKNKYFIKNSLTERHQLSRTENEIRDNLNLDK